jgi:5'-nucleotidase
VKESIVKSAAWCIVPGRRARGGAALGALVAIQALAVAGCGDDGSVNPTGTTSGGEGGGGGGTTVTSGTGGQGGEGGQGGQGGEAGTGGQGGEGGAPPQMVQVQLLAFNDFHGNLQPPAGGSGRIKLHDDTFVDAGGAAFFATHMAALRATNPNTVVVAAGDLIGASPLVSALFHDEPTIETMNMIGLEISSVGNHEFDDGASELLRMQYGGCSPVDGCADGTFFPGASFHYLSANVFVDTNTGKTLLPAYEIREFEGVKIGFIGMTLEGTPSIVTPSGIAGLAFTDEVDTANAIVPELQAQGVETIVVLIHEGGLPTGYFDECPGISGAIVDIATNLDPAIDVIASGHTHQAYVCDISGKLVTSAASFGRLITDIDLEVDAATGDVITKQASNVIVTREVADPVVDAFVTNYVDLAAPLANQQIGTITGDLVNTADPMTSGLTPMGAVIADSQLFATQAPAFGGAQIAFMNPGGVRASLLYAASPLEATDGIVTYGEAFTVQPFGNSLVVMTLTGDQIKMLLEQQFTIAPNGTPAAKILQVSQGFTYAYSQSAPIGSKVDMASIQLNGVPIVGSQTYRVTVNSFLASGGDSFAVLVNGTDRLGGAIDLEAMEEYLAASSPVSPPALDRITLLP